MNATCYTRVVRLPRDIQLFPHERRFITGTALLAVALGGIVGSAARWGAGELWPSDPDQWSWDILIVNVVGSLAIGFAARRFVIGTLAADFVITGVLGGFTTFSTFTVVLDDLVDAGRAGLALLYAAVTLVAGITAAGIATGLSGAARGHR